MKEQNQSTEMNRTLFVRDWELNFKKGVQYVKKDYNQPERQANSTPRMMLYQTNQNYYEILKGQYSAWPVNCIFMPIKCCYSDKIAYLSHMTMPGCGIV